MRSEAGVGWAAVLGLTMALGGLGACGSEVKTTGGGGSGATSTGGTTTTSTSTGGNTGGTSTTSTSGTGNTGAVGGSGGSGGSALPTGDCVGPQDCGGAACVAITPGGWRSCADPPVEATQCQNPSWDQCCSTADCIGGTGICLVEPIVPFCGGAMPEPYNVCATDECTDDSACKGPGYDGICLPAPMLGRKVRSCLSVPCHVNSDCTAEAGGYCAPVDDPCCYAPSGLYCVYPSGCRTDADCPGGYCEPSSAGAQCKPGGPVCPA